MANWVLSILMLAGGGLLIAGIFVIRKGDNAKQGWLMIVAAAVMFANVVIWAAPVKEGGPSLADEAQ